MNCVIRVNEFRPNGQPKLDKHDKESVYLEPIWGQFPEHRNVVSGTIAERQGLKVGKLYQIMAIEKEEHPQFGRQFEFKMIREIDSLELIGKDTFIEYVSTSSPITTNFENEEVKSSVPF